MPTRKYRLMAPIQGTRMAGSGVLFASGLNWDPKIVTIREAEIPNQKKIGKMRL